MKEILYHYYEIQLDDGSWEEMTCHWSYKYDHAETLIFNCKTFDELYQMAGTFPYIKKDDTLFRHRPQVRIRFNLDSFTVNARNFARMGPFMFRERQEVAHPSMKFLYENLSCEEFSNYLKDRDIKNISIKG